MNSVSRVGQVGAFRKISHARKHFISIMHVAPRNERERDGEKGEKEGRKER